MYSDLRLFLLKNFMNLNYNLIIFFIDEEIEGYIDNLFVKVKRC